MPGLRIRARRRMARGFEDQIIVVARYDATRMELARRQPVAHDFEQRLAALARLRLMALESFSSHSTSLLASTPLEGLIIFFRRLRFPEQFCRFGQRKHLDVLELA